MEQVQQDDLLTKSRPSQYIALMTTAIIGKKGQITIPKAIRKALLISGGDRVEFIEVAHGQFLLVASTRSVVELRSKFGKPKKALSIEEMNHAIASAGMASRCENK